MKKEELIKEYKRKKNRIKDKLREFKKLKKEEYYHEFVFCTLTPQSNGQRCWAAAQEVIKIHPSDYNEERLKTILISKTRFHNNKAKYLVKNREIWSEISILLEKKEGIELRNKIAEMVNGYGLKEAGHFMRNIGKSENKVAILDRHILRNLKDLGVIKEDKIKNNKNYLEIEKKFLNFADKINISIDELDLLFWSNENGEIFK